MATLRPPTFWFTLPHLLSLACFAFAFAWMAHVGTNRSITDLNAGIVGFVLLGIGLLATLARLVTFPWRSAGTVQWLWLGVHTGALVLAVLAAHNWLAAHIA